MKKNELIVFGGFIGIMLIAAILVANPPREIQIVLKY